MDEVLPMDAVHHMVEVHHRFRDIPARATRPAEHTQWAPLGCKVKESLDLWLVS